MNSEKTNVRYKCIEHERTQDAPFIGALICAIDCNLSCKGCFNQHLKNRHTKISTSKEIIYEVLKNEFNEGIILGGLEWSLQMDEAISLCKIARKNNLKTIIYTGHSFDWCMKYVKDFFCVSDYIKFGKYIIGDERVSSNGVSLSSGNQKIIYTL